MMLTPAQVGDSIQSRNGERFRPWALVCRPGGADSTFTARRFETVILSDMGLPTFTAAKWITTNRPRKLSTAYCSTGCQNR